MQSIAWESALVEELQLQRFNDAKHWRSAVVSLTSRLFPNEYVLDFGCGVGCLTRKIAKVVGEDSVLGVDPSGQVLDIARETYPRLMFRSYGWLMNNSVLFDRVVSAHGIAMVRDPDECVEVLRTHTKIGGKLLFVVPSAGYRALLAGSGFNFPPMLHEWTSMEFRHLMYRHGLQVDMTCKVGRTWLGFSESFLVVAKRKTGGLLSAFA